MSVAEDSEEDPQEELDEITEFLRQIRHEEDGEKSEPAIVERDI